MNLFELSVSRHSCKAFDPARRIAGAHLEQLKTLLVNAPSSINSQPWRFIVAGSEQGRARILASMTAPTFAGNAAKVRNASHTIVLCAKKALDDAHLRAVLEAEDRAGRFASLPDFKSAQEKGRAFYVGLHRQNLHDEPAWLARQVYIALGTLLLGAAALGIDACTMEGFDPEALDRELGLEAAGYTALVTVALGYRDAAADFNAALPKSRLPESALIVEI